MTTSSKSPVIRETASTHRGRPLVVKVCSRWLEIREKGRRFTVTVDVEAAYHLGCRILAANERRERLEARKARRKASQGVN